MYDFITTDMEQYLVNAIDQQEWSGDLSRRTQHYGYKYDYKARSSSRLARIGDLPSWCNELIQLMIQRNIFTASNPPQQLIINEYMPGQGIAKHIDSNVFGEPIVSLTLGSGCDMNFYKDGTSKSLYLTPRSLLVLRDDARWNWSHEIPKRQYDTVNGERTPRGRRISMTFRVLAQ